MEVALSTSSLITSSKAGRAWTAISELVGSDGIFVDGDWIESKDQDPAGDVRLVQLADVGEGAYRNRSSRFLTRAKAIELGCTFLVPGDILIARMPEPIGRACIFPGDPKACVTAVDVSIVRTGTVGVMNAWLVHAINSPQFRTAVCEQEQGTTRKRIPRSKLGAIALALPPLAEQKRIVAKVEELLGRVKIVRERLAKVPAILKRFRQSVLSAACSGRLTAEWRGKGGNDEEAVPLGWRLSTVASVSEMVVDCPHSTPKWTTSGELCLRTTNFQVGQLDLAEVRYDSPDTYRKRTARLEPRHGDVLYSREGGILGIACVMPRDLRACLGQRMMLMRANATILSVYLMHVLNSPLTLERVRELTGGTAAPHLNVADVKEFRVSLPPLEEQHEIVRRVEALFKLADAIEKRVAAATARTDKLTQSILAKAFRGELVPTEAELARAEGREYESAAVLLERIRCEREKKGGRRG